MIMGVGVAIGVGITLVGVNFGILVGARYLSTYTRLVNFPFDPQIILMEMIIVFVFLSIVLWGATFTRQMYDNYYGDNVNVAGE